MMEEMKNEIWGQFGAAIDTLENAIRFCPDDLWSDQSKYHQLWYMAYHTLFWLDYYLCDDPDDFRPPEPYGLEELDPSGLIPERPYTKDELLTYLEHCRNKCRETIRNMTQDRASKLHKFGKIGLTRSELLLYNLRHVQHHAAQMNLLIRQNINSAPKWVPQARFDL